jgi:hypothetical protein
LLRLLCDPVQLALRLRAETAQSNVLHSVCDRSDVQLAADMWRSIRLLETALLLAKLPDLELGQARQRCPPGIPFVGRPRLSRAGGSFDKSEPVHRLARGVSALRDRDRRDADQ